MLNFIADIALPPLLEALQGSLQNPLWGLLISVVTGGLIPFVIYAMEQGRRKKQVATEVAYEFERRGFYPKTSHPWIRWRIWNRGVRDVKVEGDRDIENPAAFNHDATLKFTFGRNAHIVNVDMMTKPTGIKYTTQIFHTSPLHTTATVTLEPFELKNKGDWVVLDFMVVDADEMKTKLAISPPGEWNGGVIDVNAYRKKCHGLAHWFLRLTLASSLIACIMAIIYLYSGRLFPLYVILVLGAFLSTLLGSLALIYFISARRKW